ncbi:MAG: lactate racemase domain-containing protein [Peptococcaceae bacterium]|jgi:hypothetical protein|nr:nickel-dependent lactate racemase [Peptococcaceae bacterium]MDH7525489.1 lactate racemase domain-containing protein [Peptococcaceae bacterium]
MSLPKLYNIRQVFSQEAISDVTEELNKSLNKVHFENLFTPGNRVAIAVGSRGIANISKIINALVKRLKEIGTNPFIVPAMGSHGGATASGQVEVLKSLGITEEYVGAPIISDMDVVELGKTTNGATVYMDKQAWSADAIVVVNRIKPHTRFRANNESGLIKMVAVGLGKHKGCSQMHAYGLFPTILEAARLALSKAPIRLGIGIVENAYEQTAKIVAVLRDEFEFVDAELLKLAKSLMPSLPVNEIDLLVVKEMGKNISGTGMDVNVIGRVTQPVLNEFDTPRIKRIVALDLTEASHGNALGMGLADVITKRFTNKIDFAATYANVLAAGVLDRGKMPVVCENDKEAIAAALNSIERLEPEKARLIFIRNTLELNFLKVSQSILEEVRNLTSIEVVGKGFDMEFNSQGNIQEEWW